MNAEQAKAVVRPQSAVGPATRASRVRARLEALDERCRPMLRVRRASDLRSPGGKHAHRYYCSHRRETGRCKNGRGILKKALDDAVRLRLDALLSEDEELHWQLLDERIAKGKKDTARPAQGVANTQAELARIDGEVERLVAALAAGSKSAAVIGEITKREPAIEALKVKFSSPEAPARPRAAAGRRPPAGCCRSRCGTPCPSSPRSAPRRAA